MTELTLPVPAYTALPTGRYGRQRRSPGALAAALALNGGAFAIILLMPATQYIREHIADTPTHWVKIDPVPPETKDDVVKPRNPTQPNHATQPDDTKPFVQDPIVPLTGTGTVIGGTIPNLDTLGGAGTVDPPIVPPHKPVFQPAAQDPRYAKAFHPDYPPALVREGLEGSVTVRVTIDASGRVTACELVRTTNRAFFEETRDQALRYWRFRPATSDGAPVESEQVLTVRFSLEDR
jgi:protein TonB